MARTTSASKSALRKSRTSTAATPKATPALSPSPSAKYLKTYRLRRKAEPLLRIQCKLRMMLKSELLAVERHIDRKLGKQRLPNPLDPWAK